MNRLASIGDVSVMTRVWDRQESTHKHINLPYNLWDGQVRKRYKGRHCKVAIETRAQQIPGACCQVCLPEVDP